MKLFSSILLGGMLFGNALFALPMMAYAAPADAPLSGEQGLIKDNLIKSTQTVFDSSPNNASAPRLVGELVKVILGVVGIIFLGLLIYGGFLWMTDQGDEAQVKNAKNVLRNATIGLLIVVMAYSATIFIVDKLLLASGIN